MQNLISFYEDRKIAQFTTADNLIRQFRTAKTDKQKTKASNAYDKIHDTPRQGTPRATNAGSKEGKQETETPPVSTL